MFEWLWIALWRDPPLNWEPLFPSVQWCGSGSQDPDCILFPCQLGLEVPRGDEQWLLVEPKEGVFQSAGCCVLHCTRVTPVGCLQSAALAVSAASAALSCSTATVQHRRWIKMVKAVAAACSHDHLIHVPRTQRNMMGLQFRTGHSYLEGNVFWVILRSFDNSSGLGNKSLPSSNNNKSEISLHWCFCSSDRSM